LCEDHPVSGACQIGAFGRYRRSFLLALVLAVAVPGVALADEIPSLLPGASAAIKGTHVSCIAAATSVTCAKAGGLSATLVKAGTVRVTKASPTKSAPGRQLGVNGGFLLANANIYCHVYVAAQLPTITCSSVTPAGGVPNTHGFDMSDRSVVVFRYGSMHDRHDPKTSSQP
jgi:hypothetical protein